MAYAGGPIFCPIGGMQRSIVGYSTQQEWIYYPPILSNPTTYRTRPNVPILTLVGSNLPGPVNGYVGEKTWISKSTLSI